MSSSHGESKDAPGTYPVLDSHAPQAFDRMPPAMPQEAGAVNSSNSRANQLRQTVQRRQPASASSLLLSEPYQQQSLQSSGGYNPQQVYPWFQQQRSSGFPQGHLTPYGWLPYNVGYQIYGEQLARPGFYQEGQVPGPQYPPSYPGHPEMPNYALGASQDFRQPMLGGPFFPPAIPGLLARGRPPRTNKPPEEAADSYEFDTSEARDNPERARKTLMLRNIPNKYTIHMLLDMLNKCHKKPPAELVYDFCYLPIDFKNRCNLGYAFVNFVDAAATIECFNAFNAKRWNDFNSKKVCEVKYARVQGKDALVEHFRNSKFPSNDIDCLPLIFEKVELEGGEEAVCSVPLHSKQAV